MRTIGTSPPIREARDKVTGRAKYVDDMAADLFVKILGSPHPHARVRSIDVGPAMQIEGVEAILTHENVPQRLIQFGTHRPSLAIDRHVRHLGDYVAAIAATSEAVAEQARRAIRVEYDVLPAVFDPEEALQPSAPRLYPEGNDFCAAVGLPPHQSIPESRQEWGDIEEGFALADVMVEHRLDIGSQAHAAIEPHVCMACWDGDQLIIWSATHTPTELHANAAEYFDLPPKQVVVLSQHVGGGFGGKYTGRYQYLACLLARQLPGKRIRLTLTREETQCYARRPRAKLHARLGATREGVITAIHFSGLFDIGAYGTFFSGNNNFHHEGGVLTYKTAHARFEAKNVHTNHFRSECMRSVQMPYLAFAVETVVELAAEKLGMDPTEFRGRNMPATDDIMPPTEYTHNYGDYPRARLDLFPAAHMLEKVKQNIGWADKWRGFGQSYQVDGPRRRGIGLAYCMGYGGFIAESGTTAAIRINPDGTVIAYSSVQELGQGINTTLCMLVAESLGLPLENVSIVAGDTRSGQGDPFNARSSHQLAMCGHILLQAVEKARHKLRNWIASSLRVNPREVVIEGDQYWLERDASQKYPLWQFVGTLQAPIMARAEGAPLHEHPLVKPGYKAHQPMIMAAEVEVDIETGEVKPIKIVAGMFPGRMINPGVVRGQAIGGAAQTLGMALWEHVGFDEESLTYLNRDFTDYRVPRALDMPAIETVLVEQVDLESPPHEGLPYGGRASGEMSAWGAVAFANAVHNAIGVRVSESPLTAEAVLRALNREARRAADSDAHSQARREALR
jgi:xanthine dehydrogenase molybdenum-binding subunit